MHNCILYCSCFWVKARIDRQKFSTEGLVHDESSSSPTMSREVGGASALSHVARIESSEVLKAATEDLLRIFQMKVCVSVC